MFTHTHAGIPTLEGQNLTARQPEHTYSLAHLHWTR